MPLSLQHDSEQRTSLLTLFCLTVHYAAYDWAISWARLCPRAHTSCSPSRITWWVSSSVTLDWAGCQRAGAGRSSVGSILHTQTNVPDTQRHCMDSIPVSSRSAGRQHLLLTGVHLGASCLSLQWFSQRHSHGLSWVYVRVLHWVSWEPWAHVVSKSLFIPAPGAHLETLPQPCPLT